MNTPTPQPSLFDPPPLPRKSRKHRTHRINEVSKLSFDEVKKKRNKAFLKILRVLSEYNYADMHLCLTARQLLRILYTKGEAKNAYDRNIVSPRLCELLDIQCVENPLITNDEGEEIFFTKRVDEDARASVWRITNKGIELLDCLEKLESEVKQ